jgi:hypothetical protein
VLWCDFSCKCGFWPPCLAEVKAESQNSRWVHTKFVLTWRIFIDAPSLFLSVAFRDSPIRNFSCDTIFPQIFRNVWSVSLFKTSDGLFLCLFILTVTTIRYHSVLFNRYSWNRIFKLRNANYLLPLCTYTACQGVFYGCDAVCFRRIVRLSKQPTALTPEAEHIQYVVNFYQTTKKTKTKLRGLSPRANYTDRAAAAADRRS